MNRLATVWREADTRTVISEAMGNTYSERYGSRPYEVITDGLAENQIASSPRARSEKRLNVYFMGSVHLTYQQNFQSLLDALNTVSENHPEKDVRLTIRGGVPFDLDPGTVPLERLGWGTQEDIEQDLETADLLYFPLPFAPEHDTFVRLSLSTKLVTYLGSGIPVLYHGPEEAAAAQLLADNDAGILACTEGPEQLADVLSTLKAVSLEANVQLNLNLARRQFMLSDQCSRFWRAFPDVIFDSDVPQLVTLPA
jgi:hypothetical protein